MSILSDITFHHQEVIYKSNQQVTITRKQVPVPITSTKDKILAHIDSKKGILFSSAYEYVGRYSRWDVGFVNPPIEFNANGYDFSIKALNKRGEIILKIICFHLRNCKDIEIRCLNHNEITGRILGYNYTGKEEERTKRVSIFTLVRHIKNIFSSKEDNFLGIYGAFGYDLIFQFEDLEMKHYRDKNQNDILLYIPDEIFIIDHHLSIAYKLSYEFEFKGSTTTGVKKEENQHPEIANQEMELDKILDNYNKGYYADLVRKAKKSFKQGDLFEVVPSQLLFKNCNVLPSELFRNLQSINPSPYGFIINMGKEFLVGSSPEMFVRVTDKKVETCPISGTIKRGKDAFEDAELIKQLLNSKKDEIELTMCTDVDRNDKSRICVPGSVRVIGRRQIEAYSHLFHTVDHIEGELENNNDALDAFISHMWAVTVTGAPKKEALQWIEDNEKISRKWYGGAIGWYSFNGDLNTGLTLRTIRLENKIAEIRVGATLLHSSIPEEEEEETLTKAAALLKVLERKNVADVSNTEQFKNIIKKDINVLVIDHEDSFVHTLSNYFKQLGVNVETIRSQYAKKALKDKHDYNLVVLSPGPGRPSRFNMEETIGQCMIDQIPIFGVCLGMQGIIEYFGGQIGILPIPHHGEKSIVHPIEPNTLYRGILNPFQVGRYHSLYANLVPEVLRVTAKSSDNIVMSIEHKDIPIWGVQFHPESILTSEDQNGLVILKNVINEVISFKNFKK